jgi:ABC-2 type transport system ATP-binding protein
VANDTPSGLASRAGGEQRIRFRPSAPLNESVLTALPEVSRVQRDGEQFLVTGNSEALQAVMAVLARQGVIAQHLRVEQATLDDAFVALTGEPSPAGNAVPSSAGDAA